MHVEYKLELSLYLYTAFAFAVDCQLFASSDYRPTNNVINTLLHPLLQRNECLTSADNRQGVCLPKASCLATGGIVAGTCGFLSFCCICKHQGTCRSVLTANESYFVSPNYPNLQTDKLDPSVCIFTLQRNRIIQKFPICQIRLDFNDFNLAPPIDGVCGGNTDSFVISGASNFNATGLPSTGLCGDLTGQHMFIEVDPNSISEPLLLIISTGNNQRYNRKWSIKIQQIPCHSPYKAPSGCLQYFTGEQDFIESFNFRGLVTSQPTTGSTVSTVVGNNYMTNLNYGICVSQQSTVCGIQWEAVEFDFGGFEKDVSG
ncbi:hypothetical protein B4U80_05545, partial [Leptotrombidium deliense]